MNRKSFLFGICILAICLVIGASILKWKASINRPGNPVNTVLRDGDLIFQTSRSAQSRAIQLATHSPYSHCGIIYRNNGKYFVYEAVQPVKLTPLQNWIERGEGGHYVVKRLKDAAEVLTPATLKNMKKAGNRFRGKNYDLYFGWSDERIYCSELIWKIYQEGAGIAIGKLETLDDFDLRDPVVKNKLRERYGDVLPLNETVISPASIFNSSKLYTVLSD